MIKLKKVSGFIMFRNTLTFKFGKTIGLLYLLSIAAGLFTIIAEKIFYAIKHTPVPSYGLFFVVIILLNAAIILVINFVAAEIILFIIDCFRMKKIMKLPVTELPLSKQIYEYILFFLSLAVPIALLL